MKELLTTEDFATPIEYLTEALDLIQTVYDVDRFEDKANAELLIDSYKYAIELLMKEEVSQ